MTHPPARDPPPPKFITNIHTLLYILGFARWIWIFLADAPLAFLNPKPKNIFAKFLRRYVALQQNVSYNIQIINPH